MRDELVAPLDAFWVLLSSETEDAESSLPPTSTARLGLRSVPEKSFQARREVTHESVEQPSASAA